MVNKALAAISIYLQNLTLSNWGFPWHILLAYWGGRFGDRISDFMTWDLSPVIIASLVMLVGFVNEWIQARSGKVKTREIVQDIIANTIGVIAYLTF